MLIDRAFANPPRHMIDGELIEALEGAHASDAEKVVLPTGDEPAPKTVDVRA
jgi:hypothetical protein